MERFKCFDINDNEVIKKHLHLGVVQDKENWPGSLIELSDFVMAEAKRQRIRKFEEALIDKVLIYFAMKCGAANLYLPKKECVRSFLSDYRDYLHFKKNKDQYKFLGRIKKLVLFFDSLYQDDGVNDKVKPAMIAGYQDFGWHVETLYVIDTLNEAIDEYAPKISEGDRYLLIGLFLDAASFMCGGKMIYIPSCTTIKAAIRNELIYRQFNGRNCKQLARKFGLSVQVTYEVIRKQRKKNGSLVL